MVKDILHTPHYKTFTLYTVHVTNYTLHSKTLYTPHITQQILYFHFTTYCANLILLYNIHSKNYSFTIYTKHSTSYIFHSTLHMIYCNLWPQAKSSHQPDPSFVNVQDWSRWNTCFTTSKLEMSGVDGFTPPVMTDQGLATCRSVETDGGWLKKRPI